MLPRLIIAGTSSGVGKTTVNIGLMAALSEKGYNIQPFKVGPDYIDPGFHTLVTGNKSRNLDSWFLNRNGLCEVFHRAAKDADLSIIEGVMGLFDGFSSKNDIGSTAHIAKILKTPVMLVINAGKMARSTLAVIYGYKNFDPELNVAGVILNNIGSQRHYEMLKDPIEEELEIPVLGYLPREKEIELSERYLGLVTTYETKDLRGLVNRLKGLVNQYMDLDKLVYLAKNVKPLPKYKSNIFSNNQLENKVDIGVAYDEAFNFYYQENLDLLAESGANLIYFSPLHDNNLPEVDGIYIGGGFPESFLEELVKNVQIKMQIAELVEKGLPLYAECGGLMYLTKEITDFNGNNYPMVGLIPGRVEMKKKLQALGYKEIIAVRDNILLKKGEKIKGHEFHYSNLKELSSGIINAYQVMASRGKKEREAGIIYNNLLASYIHLYFPANIKVVERFIKKCDEYKKMRDK